MRTFIASLVEGIIVGGILGLTLRILDIEVTTAQITTLLIVVFISTSAASAVARFIAKGEAPLACQWVYKFGENRIDVTAGLTEKLYINDELADTSKGIKLKQATLKGELSSGEKVSATLSSGLSGITCQLLVDGKEVEVFATKGDLIKKA